MPTRHTCRGRCGRAPPGNIARLRSSTAFTGLSRVRAKFRTDAAGNRHGTRRFFVSMRARVGSDLDPGQTRVRTHGLHDRTHGKRLSTRSTRDPTHGSRDRTRGVDDRVPLTRARDPWVGSPYPRVALAYPAGTAARRVGRHASSRGTFTSSRERSRSRLDEWESRMGGGTHAVGGACFLPVRGWRLRETCACLRGIRARNQGRRA
jgi:hypothetical protein